MKRVDEPTRPVEPFASERSERAYWAVAMAVTVGGGIFTAADNPALAASILGGLMGHVLVLGAVALLMFGWTKHRRLGLPAAMALMSLALAYGNIRAHDRDRQNAESAVEIMNESAERLVRWSPKLDTAMAVILAEVPDATDDELREALPSEGYTSQEVEDILRYRGLLAGFGSTDPGLADTLVSAYLELGGYTATEIANVLARRSAGR